MNQQPKLILLLATILLLGACGATDHTDKIISGGNASLPTSSMDMQQPSISGKESVPIDRTFMENQLNLYIYDPQTTLYKEVVIQEASMDTYEDIIGYLEEEMGIPFFNIGNHKSEMHDIVFDFSNEFAQTYDEATQQQILSSIDSTLARNLWASNADYLMDGVKGVLYQEDSFQPHPLMLVENTQESYDKVRATIPYEGLAPIYSSGKVTHDTPLLEKFSHSISRYASDILYTQNPLALSYSTIIANTISYSSYPSDEQYVSQILPLAAGVAVDDDKFGGSLPPYLKLKEHLESTAKVLYDMDIIINHEEMMESLNKMTYYDKQGVLYQSPIGGGGPVEVIVADYEELEDCYLVEFVIISMNMDTHEYWAESGWKGESTTFDKDLYLSEGVHFLAKLQKAQTEHFRIIELEQLSQVTN